jgi:hypothetical protein
VQDKIGLPGIAFGAQTTLAYTENSTNTGINLTVSDGTHTANAVGGHCFDLYLK